SAPVRRATCRWYRASRDKTIRWRGGAYRCAMTPWDRRSDHRPRRGRAYRMRQAVPRTLQAPVQTAVKAPGRTALLFRDGRKVKTCNVSPKVRRPCQRDRWQGRRATACAGPEESSQLTQQQFPEFYATLERGDQDVLVERMRAIAIGAQTIERGHAH